MTSFREVWGRNTQMPERHRLLLAGRVIAEQDAEIARLQAELDQYHGRTVLHCTEAMLDDAAVTSLDEPDGTILRATDTGRELVMDGRMWRPR